VLRQRNALLRAGIRNADDTTTLEVFDRQLAHAGATLAAGRVRLLVRLEPLVSVAYAELAGGGHVLVPDYQSAWWPGTVGGDASSDEAAVAGEQALVRALKERRRADLERRVTLAGPHRDEWRLQIGELDTRVHASQGEQRTLALALRIAGHRLTTEVIGRPPVLLLDDVFSELDEHRAAALLAHLDAGQTIVTTAGEVPAGVRAARVLRIDDGRVEEAA
jgi:DNA replication and repair protein RecF